MDRPETSGRMVVIDPLQIYPVGVLAGANTTTDDARSVFEVPYRMGFKNVAD